MRVTKWNLPNQEWIWRHALSWSIASLLQISISGCCCHPVMSSRVCLRRVVTALTSLSVTMAYHCCRQWLQVTNSLPLTRKSTNIDHTAVLCSYLSWGVMWAPFLCPIHVCLSLFLLAFHSFPSPLWHHRLTDVGDFSATTQGILQLKLCDSVMEFSTRRVSNNSTTQGSAFTIHFVFDVAQRLPTWCCWTDRLIYNETYA